MTFTFFELLHTFFRTRPKAIKTRGSAVAERERERERERADRTYLLIFLQIVAEIGDSVDRLLPIVSSVAKV